MKRLNKLEAEERELLLRLAENPLDGVANTRWIEIQKELAKYPLDQRTGSFING